MPRPHTEPLARRTASLLPTSGTAVDLCTGAGAIAAVLAAARPAATVVATELDAVAARCARRNGVEVFQGSLDEPLPRSLEHGVDVMTAVVPYVPSDAIRLLPRDVQAFEPKARARRRRRRHRPAGRGGEAEHPVAPARRLAAARARRATRRSLSAVLLVELGFDAPDVMVDDEGDPRAICARLAGLIASTAS